MNTFLIAATAIAAETPKPVDMQWGVKIPMRDGVHLNATISQPAGQKEPLPVVSE